MPKIGRNTVGSRAACMDDVPCLSPDKLHAHTNCLLCNFQQTTAAQHVCPTAPTPGWLPVAHRCACAQSTICAGCNSKPTPTTHNRPARQATDWGMSGAPPEQYTFPQHSLPQLVKLLLLCNVLAGYLPHSVCPEHPGPWCACCRVRHGGNDHN
jgi:hypothetical protein